MEALLQKIQQRIHHQETSPQLECWLQDVGLSMDPHGDLILLCPNSFSMDWIKENYTDPLCRVIEEEVGRKVALSFQVNERKTDLQGQSDATVIPTAALPTTATASLSPVPPVMPADTTCSTPLPELNRKYRFSEFVVGPSNRFAWSAAQEILSRFVSHYNPFLLLAPTGLGKTHLGQAMGHSMIEQDPTKIIRYCTAEGFFTEMIQHINKKTIFRFKEYYRTSCDVLILDDIQFVLGKKALQSELVYTLDSLLNQDKQVIILGNLPSPHTAELDENLASRLFSGLSLSVERPDYETRLAILHHFASLSPILFSEENLETLARLNRSNVRNLEGAFKRLLALQSLSTDPIDAQTLETHLENLPVGPAQRSLTLNTIRQHVAGCFGLDPHDLSSRSRHKKVLLPRQVAMYLSRKHTFESLEAIGSLYNRDHSSVIHAVKSLKKKTSCNTRLLNQVRFVEEKLLEKT